MGMGECMGANVAYSLYGVLPEDKNGKHSACRKGTFINSFFTTDGLSSFVAASNKAVDTSSISYTCSVYDNYYSTTTGCSSSGKFTIDTFSGQGCSGIKYNSTVDTLDELNANLTNSMGCTLIYSSDGSVNYATKLLSNSSVCTIDGKNRHFCPDPYGMVRKYEYNFAMAQKYSNYTVNLASQYEIPAVAKVASSVLFFAAGLGLLASSAWHVISNKHQKKIKSKGRKIPQTELKPSADYGFYT